MEARSVMFMSIEPLPETSLTGALHIMVLEALAAAGPAINATGTGDVRLLTFYVVIALGISFLCSILEAPALARSASAAGRMERTAAPSSGRPARP